MHFDPLCYAQCRGSEYHSFSDCTYVLTDCTITSEIHIISDGRGNSDDYLMISTFPLDPSQEGTVWTPTPSPLPSPKAEPIPAPQTFLSPISHKMSTIHCDGTITTKSKSQDSNMEMFCKIQENKENPNYHLALETKESPLPSEDEDLQDHEQDVQLQDTVQFARVIQKYAANLKEMVNDKYALTADHGLAFNDEIPTERIVAVSEDSRLAWQRSYSQSVSVNP